MREGATMVEGFTSVTKEEMNITIGGSASVLEGVGLRF